MTNNQRPTHNQLPTHSQLLSDVQARAVASNVFGTVAIRGDLLTCEARASAAPAEYRLYQEDGIWWAALMTADRWLSGSIELDLLHTGDKMDELVEEELIELGSAFKVAKVEHFRSASKMYTFRIRVPAETDTAAAVLLALEAAFRNLGDMSAGDEDEA